MTVSLLRAGTLGEINVGVAAAIPLINPMLVQFDANLYGSFGLGAIVAQIELEYAAALQASAQIGIAIGDPLAPLYAAISAVAQLQASLEAAIAIGLPSIALQAGFTAALGLSAQLKLQLAGLEALLSASLSVKIPLIEFLAKLNAALSLGPFGAWTFDGQCTVVAEELKTLMTGGIGAPPMPSAIGPYDTVYGIMLLTKKPEAFAGIQFLFGV
jgi:hypothetical protein